MDFPTISQIIRRNITLYLISVVKNGALYHVSITKDNDKGYTYINDIQELKEGDIICQ